MESLFAALDLVYALLAAGAIAAMAFTPHITEARQAMDAVVTLVILRWGLTIALGKLSWGERLLAAVILIMFLASALPRFNQWADERETAVGQTAPAAAAMAAKPGE